MLLSHQDTFKYSAPAHDTYLGRDTSMINSNLKLLIRVSGFPYCSAKVGLLPRHFNGVHFSTVSPENRNLNLVSFGVGVIDPDPDATYKAEKLTVSVLALVLVLYASVGLGQGASLDVQSASIILWW